MVTRSLEVAAATARIERVMDRDDLDQEGLIEELMKELRSLQNPVDKKHGFGRSEYYNIFKPQITQFLCKKGTPLVTVISYFAKLSDDNNFLPEIWLRRFAVDVLTMFCFDKFYAPKVPHQGQSQTEGMGTAQHRIAPQRVAGLGPVQATQHPPVPVHPLPVDKSSMQYIVEQTSRNIEALIAQPDITKDALIFRMADELKKLQTWFHRALGEKPPVTVRVYSDLCSPFTSMLWKPCVTVIDAVKYFADTWATNYTTSDGNLRRNASKMITRFCDKKKFPDPVFQPVVYPVQQDFVPRPAPVPAALPPNMVCMPAIPIPNTYGQVSVQVPLQFIAPVQAPGQHPMQDLAPLRASRPAPLTHGPVPVPVLGSAPFARGLASSKKSTRSWDSELMVGDVDPPPSAAAMDSVVTVPETPQDEPAEELESQPPRKKPALVCPSQAPKSLADSSEFDKFFATYVNILRDKNPEQNKTGFEKVTGANTSQWNVHSVKLFPIPGIQGPEQGVYVMQFAVNMAEKAPGTVHTTFVLRSLSKEFQYSCEEIKLRLHSALHRLSPEDQAFTLTTTTKDRKPYKNSQIDIRGVWSPVNEHTRTSVRSIIAALVNMVYPHLSQM